MQARKAGQASAQRKSRLFIIPAEKRKYEKMDANTIVTIVNSVGFPIVCCGALFWYMITQRKVHTEESNKLSDTINNNTNAIIALAELIREREGLHDDLK